MTTAPRLRPAFALLLLAAAACNQSEYEIIPDYPTYEDTMC